MTDTAQHTAGPWRFLEADDPLDARIGPWTICDADNNDLVDVYSSQNATVNISREEGLANARLIAAAPELLEAAKRLSELSDQIYVKLSNEEQRLLREAWQQMDTAIAKATNA